MTCVGEGALGAVVQRAAVAPDHPALTVAQEQRRVRLHPERLGKSLVGGGGDADGEGDALPAQQRADLGDGVRVVQGDPHHSQLRATGVEGLQRRQSGAAGAAGGGPEVQQDGLISQSAWVDANSPTKKSEAKT